MSLKDTQEAVCRKFSADFFPLNPTLKLGVSAGVLVGEMPVHGLRHPLQSEATGWYLWTGELSDQPEFFQPFHASHLIEQMHVSVPYLGLPPGWRFLVDRDYEDVWFDPSLLEI